MLWAFFPLVEKDFFFINGGFVILSFDFKLCQGRSLNQVEVMTYNVENLLIQSMIRGRGIGNIYQRVLLERKRIAKKSDIKGIGTIA